MAVSQYVATIIAACMSTFLFGFYVSLATRCSVILWGRSKSRRRLHAYLLVTHFALVILVTTRAIVVLVRMIQPAVAETYVTQDPWTKSSLFVNALWMISVIVSDAFITYRSYVVWARNPYIVILPIALILGNIGRMADQTLGSSNEAEYFVKFGDVVRNFSVVTLTLNLVNTGLISYRIWTVRKKTATSRVGADSLSGLISLLVESAAIYTIVLIAHIILICLNNWLLFVFTDMQTPIIGIVFSNIIISVTQGSAFGDTSGTGGTSGDRVTWPRSGTNVGRGAVATEINMQTIITTQRDPLDIEQDHDGKDYIDTGSSIIK
ncbi:hypothetical protein BT96DRAFT_914956 [Gymnopus androsaceus JB14]|uniref:G-protein coupled receptors family 1 profile domain-containing protein n=1 Tax=Gymnopus androsaceus JB14 TaxID=1447944 RepID=A0A6A4ICS2_9AGAR|nr:hypothetical protein BT96DRAFT_914956 [Gymnopus androsaceus JB14]